MKRGRPKKIPLLPDDCRMTINFDQSSWDYVQAREQQYGGCGVSAVIRMLIQAEMARNQTKEITAS